MKLQVTKAEQHIKPESLPQNEDISFKQHSWLKIISDSGKTKPADSPRSCQQQTLPINKTGKNPLKSSQVN